MSTENKKPSNPRMHNLDGMYASEARQEDYVSLRDYFANSAMQAMLSNQDLFLGIIKNADSSISGNEAISKSAYSTADAMLKQREL